ncbi:MAG TPA: hypothetical protein VMF08_01495 [Candidatus Sulfotelmatobacter sp.]|nr:hypothetical protein [Candidatus Sulfotelmatobacter sp.]
MFSAVGRNVKAGSRNLRFTIYAVEGLLLKILRRDKLSESATTFETWKKSLAGYNCSMPDDAHEAVRRKAEAIFAELAGERGLSLRGYSNQVAVRNSITLAYSSDKTPEVAREIAFHMTDWGDHAAFVVALHLFPERFAPEEIEAGIGMLCAHVPAHVIAAARLTGFPTEDLFLEG